MKKELIKIISFFGVLSQLKYFQSEIFELNEAILNYEYESQKMYPSIDPDAYYEARDLKAHIAEEIADCYVMLEQFRLYYDIENVEITKTMKNKIKRTLDRIESGYYE